MPGHGIDRISIGPRIMAGKPVGRGTRVPVERVLQHLSQKDRADLFEAFPNLTEDDVKANLDYARNAVERLCRSPAHP